MVHGKTIFLAVLIINVSYHGLLAIDHGLQTNLNKHFIHISPISFHLLDCFPLLLQIALFGAAFIAKQVHRM